MYTYGAMGTMGNLLFGWFSYNDSMSSLLSPAAPFTDWEYSTTCPSFRNLVPMQPENKTDRVMPMRNWLLKKET